MKRSILCIVFLCLIAIASAQIVKQPAGSKSVGNDQQKIDNQLANKFFQEQDYENAKLVYDKLYKNYHQNNHFNQYIECLIRLKDYEEAEKKLKRFIQDNPTHYKSKADLLYIYSLQEDKKTKADKFFSELLKNMPDNSASVKSLSSSLRNRSLNDKALLLLEKAEKESKQGEHYYMERASIYQAMINYHEAFKYYFLELDTHPEQYKNIKNKLQTLLLYDVNKSITEEMRIALLKETQEKPDNVQFAELLVWLALQEEDYDIALLQSQSIDRRIGNQEGQILELAGICLNNKQFDIALEGYEYVYNKGKESPFYGEALAGIINTDYNKLEDRHTYDRKPYENLSKTITQAYEELNSKEAPRLAMIQADIFAYHLGKSDEAIALLQQHIENTFDSNEKSKLKLKLADIYLYQDEVWEATLLYSQVDKSMKEEPLGHEARFKNAQLRYFIGEFDWAQAQLKVLKAATSKLIANDAMTLSLIISDNLESDTTGTELRRLSRADYCIYRQRDDKALPVLDSIISSGNETSVPHALFRKAELEEKAQDYNAARSHFMDIATRYSYSYMADDALMHAALLDQNRLNDPDAAMENYERLIDQYPTSIFSAQAKKNYRKLQNR